MHPFNFWLCFLAAASATAAQAGGAGDTAQQAPVTPLYHHQAASAAVNPTRRLQQAANATTCSQGFYVCGSRCVRNNSAKLCAGRCVTSPKPCINATCTPCSALANGRAVCFKAAATAARCSIVCNTGFALRNSTGTRPAPRCVRLPAPPPPPPPPPSPSPPPPPPPPAVTVSDTFFGLRANKDGTRVTGRQQLRAYEQLFAAKALVMAVLAAAAAAAGAPPSRADLVRAVCGGSGGSVCGAYADALTLALLPAAYSSNNTGDTGGWSLISPAQDQQSCAACVGFAGTAAAEAAINTALKRDHTATSLSEQDLSFCRMANKISCSTGSSYRDLLDSAAAGRLQRWASREASPYQDNSFDVDCSAGSVVPNPGPVYIGCFKEPNIRSDAIYECGGVNQRPLMFMQSSPADMTVAACVNLARLRGFSYAAVQAGKECFGGDDISAYKEAGTCTLPCGGDPKQNCGGNCANSIYQIKPAGGAFKPAASGNSLESMARIKRQILLSGGALTSMVVYTDLTSDYRPGPDDVYSTSQANTDGSLAAVDLHALFCYGWDDARAAWLCKNSWSADWGLPGGSFWVAFGAAFIMQPDYTFGLEFVVDDSERSALELLRTNSVPDTSQPGCWLFSPPQPTRLLQLVQLVDLALAELQENDVIVVRPSTLQILEELLLANAVADSSSGSFQASSGPGELTSEALAGLRGGKTAAASSQQPFRICGSSAAGLNPPPTQLDALLAVKAAIDPNGFVLKDWTRAGGATGGYCKWQGITCNEAQDVTSIDLYQKALGGVLPHCSVWPGLPSLNVLWLQDCALGGTLPARLHELPQLQFVYFSQNNITSTLPAEWGRWGHLLELQLWGNPGIKGQLPPSWGANMTSLTSLGLGNSQLLTGSIPESWSSMKSLRDVRIVSGALSGSIPAAVTQWTELQTLWLWGLALTGSLPAGLADLPNLGDLSLARNQLSGQLSMLARASKLTSLVMFDNRFDGPLPEFSWPDMAVLSLGSCDFSGPIPDSWGQMSKLTDLYVSFNRLSGSLPQALSALGQLKSFWAQGNQLSNSIPAAYGPGMVALADLALWNNAGLTGCIPKEFEGRVNQPGSGRSVADITSGTGISGFCAEGSVIGSSSGGRAAGRWQRCTALPPAARTARLCL